MSSQDRMDQRELEATVKALNKTISAREPAATALTLLDSLKKGKPTEEMLRSTRAGIVVGRLRTNENKDIARAAAILVARWKKIVDMEKKGHSLKAASSSPSVSAAAVPPSTGPKTFKGDPEKRRHETDGVDIKRTESATRNACIGLMYNGLAYRSTDPEDAVLAKAVAVEAAAFRAYNGETADYRNKLRSLFQNLKNKTNRELGRKVMSGELVPDRFVVLTHEELKSAEQRIQDDKLEAENMKKAQVPQAEKSISTSFQCSKCQQRKVSYSQAQTRSADEPMTTFCECLNCGNRWKFS